MYLVSLKTSDGRAAQSLRCRLKPAGIVKHFRDSFEAYKKLCTTIRFLNSARASARGSPVTRFHDRTKSHGSGQERGAR